MQAHTRSSERKLFLESLLDSGKIKLEQAQQPKIQALPSDASNRKYFRIFQAQKNFLLMDAPPQTEKTAPFIQIAKYLQAIGLRAPEVYAADTKLGFLLIEDFGDNSFSKLLKRGCKPLPLYQDALAVLIHIVKSKDATAEIPCPKGSVEFWLKELAVFSDYYLHALLAKNDSAKNLDKASSAWQKCWREILLNLPPIPQVLILRDCHVDNLMLITDTDSSTKNSPLNRCGLLDFQDAVVGSPAYDLVSLLEDARCDLAPDLQKQLLLEYLAQSQLDRDGFMLHYQVWAAQRHARVLGTFARLAIRDGKQALSIHFPRVLRLLENCLARDAKGARANHILKPLVSWFDTYLPEHEAKLARCLHKGEFLGAFLAAE